MMQPDVPASPLAAFDRPRFSFEIWIVVPGVASAWDSFSISPVIVALAVRSEMDRPDLGHARIACLMTREAFEQVAFAPAGEDVGQDRLGAMAEVLQHLSNAALEVEPHDHKTPPPPPRPFQPRRLLP